MLKIKQKLHLSLPHFDLKASQPVAFSPVTDDDDELTQAIVAEPLQHDDEWQLEEHPDENKLEQFWESVEDDIKHDPKWIKFSEDEEAA